METQNKTMMLTFLSIFGADKKAYIGDIQRGQEMHLSRLVYKLQIGEKKNVYRIIPSRKNKNSLTILVTTFTDGETNIGTFIHIFEMKQEDGNGRYYLLGEKGDKNYSMKEIFDRYTDMEYPIVADYTLLGNHKCGFCY